MTKRRVIAVLVLVVGVAVIIFAGSRLFEAQRLSRQTTLAYEAIAGQVKREVASGARESALGIPALSIDFDALKEMNKDTAGWLYCPGTVIDYPVMSATDYSYYLEHLADGTLSMNGSLFIDYNNASDFSDPLTVIYGHHTYTGIMFGSLMGYKTQEYYDDHPYLYLYTPTGNYRVELLYGCVIGAGKWRDRAFMYSDNVGSFLDYAKHYTTFQSNTEYEQGMRVVALSTCSYEFDGARYVVVGLLRPEV
ncbi:MAG: class B sortase [Coriobacteriales bacterium]|jgi:sortase B|nr:class B sortase [Coriobacteriales bacterium]